jgi:hypothetical protein
VSKYSQRIKIFKEKFNNKTQRSKNLLKQTRWLNEKVWKTKNKVKNIKLNAAKIANERLLKKFQTKKE